MMRRIACVVAWDSSHARRNQPQRMNSNSNNMLISVRHEHLVILLANVFPIAIPCKEEQKSVWKSPNEPYEEWKLQLPPISPRSVLYALEPMGIGTPQVECLTSYISRLAEA